MTNPKGEEGLLLNFLIGAVAGCGAVTASNPFDCAKTRLQLQGELKKAGEYQRVFKGVLDTVLKTYKHEGIGGVQRGLITAYYFQVVMNGIRLGGYETFKMLRSEKSRNNPFFNFISGFASGFTGGLLASPFQLIKVRQQSSSFASENFKYNYKGTWDGWSKIYQAEGLRGLYSGCVPFGWRTALAGAVQLSSYDAIKHQAIKNFGMQEGRKLYITSSLLATLIACLAMSPLDVVTTRIYNQKYDNGVGTLYKGTADCFIKIVRIEGVLGLYKGFTALCSRLGPHSIIFLLFSEFLRQEIRKF